MKKILSATIVSLGLLAFVGLAQAQTEELIMVVDDEAMEATGESIENTETTESIKQKIVEQKREYVAKKKSGNYTMPMHKYSAYGVHSGHYPFMLFSCFLTIIALNLFLLSGAYFFFTRARTKVRKK